VVRVLSRVVCVPATTPACDGPLGRPSRAAYRGTSDPCHREGP
jgi:hypothetical protein